MNSLFQMFKQLDDFGKGVVAFICALPFAAIIWVVELNVEASVEEAKYEVIEKAYECGAPCVNDLKARDIEVD